MATNVKMRGVTGKLQIHFAIPTDDPKKWQMKNGSITFANGATVGVDVEGGTIPQSKSTHGLTVTYHVFTRLAQEGGRMVGDVARYNCVDGSVMEVKDIAVGVEVLLPPEVAWKPKPCDDSLTD